MPKIAKYNAGADKTHKVLQVRISDTLQKKLNACAKMTGLPPADFVRKAIIDSMNAEEAFVKVHGPTSYFGVSRSTVEAFMKMKVSPEELEYSNLKRSVASKVAGEINNLRARVQRLEQAVVLPKHLEPLVVQEIDL